MKGQQKTAETEEGTVQIQEGAVATGEDPTSVAIASIQSAATFPDPNVKYVFRTENGGQVMYRVIQVSEGQLDGQTEGSGAISGYPATQSMTQAVIQGAFTSDDAVDTEGAAAETHYTYFPSTAVGDGKGGILSKACDYIQELRQSNHRLSEELQGLDQLQLDNDVLRQQVEDLKNKNLLLRAQLRHHGLEVVIKNDSN
ncbi:upstream stimulatory factor 1 [Mastomys coucha]|uniref:upstream stimulatory factor 1 n=1 Tax=Mastomys coucha TaxID=35658 RepID=UPI0012617F57|nr:upstream stimulatory factor 1 [Mastomys coucha]